MNNEIIITVGRLGAETAIVGPCKFPVWCIKRYRKHLTAAGHYVARLDKAPVGELTMTDREPSAKIRNIASKLAEKQGVRYKEKLIHNQRWPEGGVL